MANINSISDAVNFDANAVRNVGSVLTGDDATAFKAFAGRFEASALSGSSEQDPKLLSSEVENVLSGLGKAGTAIVATLVNKRISAGSLDVPIGVDVVYHEPVIQGFGSARTETYSFQVKQEVILAGEDCIGTGASCVIAVDVNVELIFSGGGPNGAESSNQQAMKLPNMAVNVIKLSGQNDSIQVSVPAADGVAGGSLTFILDKVDGEFVSAEVTATELVADINLTISDMVTAGSSLTAAIVASVPELVMNVSLDADTPTEVELLHLVASQLSAGLTVANGEDQLSADVAVGTEVVGSAPFTYIFGDELQKVGESDTDFLSLSGVADYEAVVSGTRLLSASLVGSRMSSDINSVNPYVVEYGGQTYSLNGKFDADGNVVELVTVDPVTGVTVTVVTKDGMRTGTVMDAEGKELGTISEAAENRLMITYSDGSTQVL